MAAPTAGAADSSPTAVAAIRGSFGYMAAAMAGKSARGIPKTIAAMST